jgi:hypothetical protein
MLRGFRTHPADLFGDFEERRLLQAVEQEP